MAEFHLPARPATSGDDPAAVPKARTAWLRGLFEFPYSVGANPEQVLELCHSHNYPHWAGMLNGNGLVERVPGNPTHIRLSPCGIWYLGTWLAERRYGQPWVEQAVRAWRRYRQNWSEDRF